jgi:hypothetical protein
VTLVHLRKNEIFSQIGARFGISQATAWRYIVETLEVLAGWVSGLHEVLTGLGEGDHVIVDGTPVWFSRATPGRTHDLTAARAHGIVQACITRQILILADRTYQGAGATIRTPVPPPPRTGSASAPSSKPSTHC